MIYIWYMYIHDFFAISLLYMCEHSENLDTSGLFFSVTRLQSH